MLLQAPITKYRKMAGKKTTFRILNHKWGVWYSSVRTFQEYHLPLEKGVTLVLTRSDYNTYQKAPHQSHTPPSPTSYARVFWGARLIIRQE
jgi:hypothetical protein